LLAVAFLAVLFRAVLAAVFFAPPARETPAFAAPARAVALRAPARAAVERAVLFLAAVVLRAAEPARAAVDLRAPALRADLPAADRLAGLRADTTELLLAVRRAVFFDALFRVTIDSPFVWYMVLEVLHLLINLYNNRNRKQHFFNSLLKYAVQVVEI
jgi:hypothetical protein